MGTEEMEQRGNHISSGSISHNNKLNQIKEILPNKISYLRSHFFKALFNLKLSYLKDFNNGKREVNSL